MFKKHIVSYIRSIYSYIESFETYLFEEHFKNLYNITPFYSRARIGIESI